ncbi:MAG TPA: S41 family peptidase [Gemmatimonadales bacterium]|nr:S41 family peptidase [Gemmatimonadales bacterium]
MKQRLGALAFVAVLSFLSGGWLVRRGDSADGNLYQQARILETVLSIIHDHALVAPNGTELFQKTARTLVDQIKDPYAELLMGDGYRDFNRQMSGTGEIPTPGALADHPIHIPATSPGLLVTPTVGYVALHSLSASAADELSGVIWDLRKRGMRSLVLDLRNDPGGLIKQGVEVAELFLPKGDTVVVTRGRTAGHSKVYVAPEAEQWPGLKLALLVNDGTASSAELIAGALQDHDRAVLIGQPTYGKGVLQTTYPLTSDMAVKLTTARWFTPSGRSVHRPRTRSDSIVAARRRSAAERGVRYRTDGGRPLADGQGIIPDLVVSREAYTPGERAFLDSLGSSYSAFRAALADCALNARANGNIVSDTFTVTSAMREQVRAALLRHNVELSPATFDGAASFIDRQLGYEIARTLFGEEPGSRRRLMDDRQMRAARELLERADNEPELIGLAGSGLD